MRDYNWATVYIAGVILFIAGVVYCDFRPQPEVNRLAEETKAVTLLDEAPAHFLADVAADKKRSDKWATCRKHFLAAHPFCAYCGGTTKLQVHHVHQFNDMTPEQRGTDAPGGELDPNNLIVLCEDPATDHHLHIGHSGNFKTSNPNVRADCQEHEAAMRKEGTWPQK